MRSWMLLCFLPMRQKMAPKMSALLRLLISRATAVALSRVIWRQLRPSSSRNCLRRRRKSARQQRGGQSDSSSA